MNAPFRPKPAGAGAPPTATFDLPKGTVVQLGADGDATLRTLVVSRPIPTHGGVAGGVLFDGVPDGAVTFLTHEQIAFLCERGEFRWVFGAHGAGRASSPPSYMRMTPADDAECSRRRAYVDACAATGSGSRPVLGQAIADLAGSLGDGNPPGVSSVLRWTDTWLREGEAFGEACLMKKVNPGNRTCRLSTAAVAEAVEHGVLSALRMPKGTGSNARDLAIGWMRANRPDVDLDGVAWPSVRTFQTKMTGTNRYVADALSFGERKARRKLRPVYERERPDLPLEAVDVDHTTFDVILVDATRKVVLGRPDLISFRCRCTGYPLGVSIGFEAPSYASFMAGFQQAIYPKDDAEYPTLQPWEAFGRPKRLHVDNALHFIGDNIRMAGAKLGFELAEFRPMEPWLKGAEERLMRTIGEVAHSLDGSTFSNVDERKRYEDVVGKPVLTLPELRAFLNWFIRDEYAVSPHQGLGFLRTLKGVPRDLWRSKIGQVRLAPLPPRSEFVALAGDAELRRVNKQGIRWDHIRYVGAGLNAILCHPDHRNGRWEEDRRGTKLEGTKYLVRRDPFDLGHVYVSNPYEPGSMPIKVPAARSDYAAGLTLHQHRVIVANADKELLAKADDPEVVLKRTYARVDRYVQFLLTEREHQGVQRKLARFLENCRRDEERSVVTTKPVSRALGGRPLDARDPAGLAPPVTASPDAPATTRPARPDDGSEVEPVVFEGATPRRQDRGEAVVAAMEARRRAIEVARAHEADPGEGASSPEERRARRLARWAAAGSTPDAVAPVVDVGGAEDAAPATDPAPPPARPPARARRGRPRPAAPVAPGAGEPVAPDGTGSPARADGRTAAVDGHRRGPGPEPEPEPPGCGDGDASAEDAEAGERRRRRAARWGNAG